MARRYEIDELLWLRSSPLVTKPASLPPVEEWMGPLPERKPKDPNNQNETTTSNRRPSIIEARHFSRGSTSGKYSARLSQTCLYICSVGPLMDFKKKKKKKKQDIILGPPRTAFASASRIAGKGSIDATERPSRIQDSDESKNDRFNFREKFFKDRESGDLDKRDGKLGTFTNRRNDKEDWNNGRPRRAFGPDDLERKPRRNGEFDRWEGRDNIRERDPRDSTTFGNRDKDSRFFIRKDGQPGRSRLEGSWFRDDNHAQDSLEAEEEKPSIRTREWRRDRHGADRDWTRGAKFEQEPEWLDSTDREEPRPVHTQEDFEQWKQRMKAGSAQVQEKREPPSEPATSTLPKLETRPTDGEIFSSTGTPLQADATMERFFGLLNEAKPSPDIGSQSPVVEPTSSKKESVPSKSIKSSRFAGLFSPPPGTPTREPEPQAVSQSPADPDQEGFQRILQMLGGGAKSRNATPQNDTPQPQRPPSLVQAEQGRSALSSPVREHLHRQDQMAFNGSPARTTAPPPGLSPNPVQEPFKDPHVGEREHLLRLMQQVRISPVPNMPHGSQGPQSAGPALGMMNIPEMMSHPPGLPTPQKGPNFLDDPAIANMQRPDAADQLRRRPANGLPMGYFDDILFAQGNNLPMTPGGNRVPQGQGHPAMGIQRPPGFEHLPPPPGFGGQQLPPQQGAPGPLAPPPGIPAPNRGMNPNLMSNVLPIHGSLPPLNDRQGFPRGAGGNGAAAFGPPLGMMPPPGYMNMNGPPPSGLPPMPHNAEALMGLGGQGPFGGNPGPQGPPPSSRHLLDMFGQASGGAPGHFR
ncbi:hypothetical protein SI65_06632 [Aspergillus cristatus]|uniref:Uncharacterized protein n=1 Tax=Aspergillus cristatus TaxID=573508 RepID=A0A1E3BAA5_ASPCR|nr:hypothetical protein SI65_06632 [Aspergillus cristatus]